MHGIRQVFRMGDQGLQRGRLHRNVRIIARLGPKARSGRSWSTKCAQPGL